MPSALRETTMIAQHFLGGVQKGHTVVNLDETEKCFSGEKLAKKKKKNDGHGLDWVASDSPFDTYLLAYRSKIE